MTSHILEEEDNDDEKGEIEEGEDEEEEQEQEQEQEDEEDEEEEEDDDEIGGFDFGWEDNDCGDDDKIDFSNMSSDLIKMMGGTEADVEAAKARNVTDWRPPEETGLDNSSALADVRGGWKDLRKENHSRAIEVAEDRASIAASFALERDMRHASQRSDRQSSLIVVATTSAGGGFDAAGRSGNRSSGGGGGSDNVGRYLTGGSNSNPPVRRSFEVANGTIGGAEGGGSDRKLRASEGGPEAGEGFGTVPPKGGSVTASAGPNTRVPAMVPRPPAAPPTVVPMPAATLAPASALTPAPSLEPAPASAPAGGAPSAGRQAQATLPAPARQPSATWQAGLMLTAWQTNLAGPAAVAAALANLRAVGLMSVPKGVAAELPPRPATAAPSLSSGLPGLAATAAVAAAGGDGDDDDEVDDDSNDETDWDEASWASWSDVDSDAEPENYNNLSPNLLRLLGKHELADQRQAQLLGANNTWQAPTISGMLNSRRIIDLQPLHVGGQEMRSDPPRSGSIVAGAAGGGGGRGAGSTGGVGSGAGGGGGGGIAGGRAGTEPVSPHWQGSTAGGDGGAGDGDGDSDGEGDDDDDGDDEGSWAWGNEEYDMEEVSEDTYLATWSTNVSANLLAALNLGKDGGGPGGAPKRNTIAVVSRLSFRGWEPPTHSGLGNSSPLMAVRYEGGKP